MKTDCASRANVESRGSEYITTRDVANGEEFVVEIFQRRWKKSTTKGEEAQEDARKELDCEREELSEAQVKTREQEHDRQVSSRRNEKRNVCDIIERRVKMEKMAKLARRIRALGNAEDERLVQMLREMGHQVQDSEVEDDLEQRREKQEALHRFTTYAINQVQVEQDEAHQCEQAIRWQQLLQKTDWNAWRIIDEEWFADATITRHKSTWNSNQVLGTYHLQLQYPAVGEGSKEERQEFRARTTLLTGMLVLLNKHRELRSAVVNRDSKSTPNTHRDTSMQNHLGVNIHQRIAAKECMEEDYITPDICDDSKLDKGQQRN